MRLSISALSLVAAAALCVPVARLSCQSPYALTVRGSAGWAHGDGGPYRDRDLSSVSMAVDIGSHHGVGSGPLLGLGFGIFSGAGESAVYRCVPDLNCPGQASFPDVRLGYVDLGWQKITRDFSIDLLLQPSVAFVSRPDIVPIGLGGGVSVARRLIGSFGLELGTSATYLPALDGVRVGLRQLTIGLRSW